MTQTPTTTGNGKISIFSGIDERFDLQTVDTLRQAMAGDMVLGTSALSRYSRNSAKLHRILEFLLAYGATILTTNYLIRPTEVWSGGGSRSSRSPTIRTRDSLSCKAFPASTVSSRRPSPRNCDDRNPSHWARAITAEGLV